MREQLKSYAYRLTSLHPGEGRKTILLALYLFLIIATYLVAKSVRDGLFLARYDVFKLPYVIIGIALAVGLFVSGYVRLAKRIEPTRLVVGTLALFISNLILFWWMIQAGISAVYPVIYIWAGMYGAIAPAQVWTLANDIFTTREAKRTFGIVGSGGIVGAIAGSYLTRAFALKIGTVPLLLIMAFLLFLAALLVLALAKHRLAPEVRLEDTPAPRHLNDSLKLIARSPHLRLIAWLVFLTALATTMADYQFKAVVVDSLGGDKDKLTAFFGTFYGTVGILSLGVQFLVTSRVLRRVGLGMTILLLPLALALASVFLIPTLAMSAAILLKGSDAAMKHSIDRSSRELAYLPVNRRIKIHVKSAIDMVVDRLGDGFGGVILLILTSAVGFGLRGIIYANLVFIALWIFVALRLKISYTRELSCSIREGQVEIGSWYEALAGAEMLGGLQEALRSGDEPRVLAALELVSSNRSLEAGTVLNHLAEHGCPEVKARAMAILLNPGESELPEGIAATFEDEDRTLFAECIEFMSADSFKLKQTMAEAILCRAGGRSRGVWVALMLRRLGDEFLPFSRNLLEHLADPVSSVPCREVAASAIGMMPLAAGLDDLLPRLLEDKEGVVVASAVRSAGALGTDTLLSLIIDQLGRPSGRQAARQVFQVRGDSMLQMLMERAQDTGVPLSIRRQIPWSMANIGGERPIRALIRLLDDPDLTMSGAARKALSRIRSQHPDLPVLSRDRVERHAMDLAYRYRRHTEMQQYLTRCDRLQGSAGELLDTALTESRNKQRAALFEVLSLHYPAHDIQNCRRSLQMHNQERRSNAAELLDSLAPATLWRALLPILYPDYGGGHQARRGPQVTDPDQTLVELSRDPDPWTSACALHLAARGGRDRIAEVALEREHDPDFRVREAAGGILAGAGHMVQAPAGVFDKLMALKRVDMFSSAPTEQLSLIAAVAHFVDLEEGAVLCRQDDPPGDLFVVIEGQAEIQRNGVKAGTLVPGESLGTWGLFENEPRLVTVQATGPMKVLQIDRWGFDDLLQEHPEVSRSLIQLLVERLRRLSR
jgi:AAA family ATP:ADP antiporter